VETIIEGVINATVVPLANLVPVLVSSGIALLIFAGLWTAFGFALVRDRARLDEAWQRIRRLPLRLRGPGLEAVHTQGPLGHRAFHLEGCLMAAEACCRRAATGAASSPISAARQHAPAATWS
jgi:hypothetical protein